MSVALPRAVYTPPRPHYLLPGQLAVFAEPRDVLTLLGTCVAVCLWDPQARVGGMNHYLLPTWRERQERARFGDSACEQLLLRLLALGARSGAMHARVFGGMSGAMRVAPHHHGIGEANIERAFDFLKGVGIPVVSSDVGGPRGRKVMFHTADGSHWVKPI